MADLALHSDPAELRAEIRAGRFTGPTAGQAPGFVQANLVVLPRPLAFDFLVFAQRNPKPCPVLEVLEPGDPVPHLLAPEADIRADVPAYRVYGDGELKEEVRDIHDRWSDEAVGFLTGCSFTFEEALLENGIPVRHQETGTNVPMYRTDREVRPAGPFHGHEVVSMRPIPAELIPRAIEVTSGFRLAHGAPLHVGEPEAIGITDLAAPDYGDPPEIRPGELPVFWACGVTPQSVALDARPPWMITHAPGHMFVTDQRK
jgi:uncharacterized protein YcsI (UPF0317 family)